MNTELRMPEKTRRFPVLLVAIVMALVLWPVLERVIDHWMPATQHSAPAHDGPTWDLRSMWS
jgi:hypothetical protein